MYLTLLSLTFLFLCTFEVALNVSQPWCFKDRKPGTLGWSLAAMVGTPSLAPQTLAKAPCLPPDTWPALLSHRSS